MTESVDDRVDIRFRKDDGKKLHEVVIDASPFTTTKQVRVRARPNKDIVFYGYTIPQSANLIRDDEGVGRLDRGVMATIFNNTGIRRELVKAYVNSLTSLPVKELTMVTDWSSHEMRDVLNSDFKVRSAKGEIILSPMRMEKFNINFGTNFASPGKIETRFSGLRVGSQRIDWLHNAFADIHFTILAYRLPTVNPLPRSVFNNFKNAGLFNAPDWSQSQAVINDAHARIDKAVLDLPVLIAESKDTIATISKYTAKLARLLKGIKRGNFKGLAPETYTKYKKRTKKGEHGSVVARDLFSDAWLEGRYAIRPIIYDINNILKLVNGKTTIVPRQTFRAKRTIESSNHISLKDTLDGTTYELEVDVTTKSVIRAGVMCELRYDTGLANDLGLFNVATTAWELIPWSFVVGWVINVNGLLASLNPNPTFRTVASWATLGQNQNLHGTLTVTSENSIKVYPIFGGHELTERTINPGRTFIKVDLNLDSYKLLDALSLLQRALP